MNIVFVSFSVMVLDNGNLMELDSPQTLLEKPDGLFRALWERHLKSQGNV
jgi:ABC-type multidrug transport system fused ATPase/permease subunit